MSFENTTICIVDDLKKIARAYKAVFERAGFNVVTFGSGSEFLSFFDKSETTIDLVLLDMMMPGMNGIQTLGKATAHSRYSSTLIVSFSEYVESDSKERLGNIGFDGYIRKTAKKEQVLEEVISLIQRKDVIIKERNHNGDLVFAVKELSRLNIEKEVVENAFIKKIISPEIFHALKEDHFSLLPAYRDIAVGFADIRGFTQLTNRVGPKEICEILAIFFDMACEKVANFGGFVDKFVGDEVMWFNQTKSCLQENSIDCINTAVELVRSMEIVNKEIENTLHTRIPLKIGVGIACGTCISGIFGAPNHRIQYSVLGAPVNLASRCCSQARGNEIILGGKVIDYCPYEKANPGFHTLKGFDYEIDLRSVVVPGLPLTRKIGDDSLR